MPDLNAVEDFLGSWGCGRAIASSASLKKGFRYHCPPQFHDHPMKVHIAHSNVAI
jgi:hypothetical protein